MIRRAGWGLACLAAFLAIGVGLARPADTIPQDRYTDITLPQERPLRLTVLGTSLSHDEIWTDRLASALSACLGTPVTLAVVAQPGAPVRWGLTQVDVVAQTRPDVVIVEFAINDADLLDGHSLAHARALHEHLIKDLRRAQPNAALVLMTMSPAQGVRGLIRARLGAHYRQYRDMAEAYSIGLIDLYPRWQALPRPARGLEKDGLHPDPEVAAGVIVPAAVGFLARAAGQGACP